MSALVSTIVEQQVGDRLLGNNNNAQQTQQDTKQAAESSVPAPFKCFVWGFTAPFCIWSKCQFMTWIILGVLAAIFYIVFLDQYMEGKGLNWGYFLCAGLSLLISLYGSFGLQDILDLRKAVFALRDQTKRLKQIQQRIKTEVGNLKDIRNKLAIIEEKQSISNAELRAQEKQFRAWSKQTFDISIKHNKLSIKMKEELQLSIERKKREIIRGETGVLYNALRQFEKTNDTEKGLNRNEFYNLRNQLPKRYRDRIAKKSFDRWSNGDNIIDHDEFRQMLDQVLTQEISGLFGIKLPGLTGN